VVCETDSHRDALSCSETALASGRAMGEVAVSLVGFLSRFGLKKPKSGIRPEKNRQ
jgi:hypothetical protein